MRLRSNSCPEPDMPRAHPHLARQPAAESRYHKGVGMINGKRIILVLSAYNAERTLEATVRELPETVDDCILVDGRSSDQTVAWAHRLGLTVIVQERNRGYGGNQ